MLRPVEIFLETNISPLLVESSSAVIQFALIVPEVPDLEAAPEHVRSEA